MNLGDLKAEFRVRVMDTERPYLWPDEEVDRWFAEAEMEAAIRSRLLRDSDEYDFTAGDTPVVDLSASIFDIQYAELRDAAGQVYPIDASSHDDQDKRNRHWRRNVGRPTFYIHNDRSLILNAIPDQDYTMYVEFFRTPSNPMEGDGDSPEIGEIHHLRLIDWVEFRAYSKPDADAANPGKAKDAEERFISVCGKRPSAELRRRHIAHRPHRNRVHL